MKKNRMMRLASGLLVAVLITTSTISGTFAKYTTSAEATDTARVAEFGVVVEASTNNVNFFTDKYGTTVDAEGEDVVAPGTESTNAMVFEVTGEPEVAVKLDVAVTDKAGSVVDNDKLENVFLAQKTALPDMTTGNATDTFDNDADYYPVVYTLKQTKATTPATVIENDYTTLEDLADALEALTSGTIDPNTNLAETIGTIEISWAWDFDDSGAGTYDKQDTLLGDLAAGTTLTPSTTLTDGVDYNLDINFKVAVSVTQVD